MTFSGYPNSGPTEQVTISRQLTLQEAEGRSLAAYRVAQRSLFYTMSAVFGAFALAALIIPGRYVSLAALMVLCCFAIALPIGILLGNAMARARGRNETGLTGRLTTTWDSQGVRIQGDNFARAVSWRDLRKLRPTGQFVVLQLNPWQNMTSTWVIGLPADFVPPLAHNHLLGRANALPYQTPGQLGAAQHPGVEPPGYVDQAGQLRHNDPS